jgi:amiloride-sensitive sodium channel
VTSEYPNSLFLVLKGTCFSELRLSYVSLLCSYRPGLNLSVNRFGDDDIFDTFQKVGPKFLEKISECAFMGIPHNCSELFTPIITDAGLCYSFNILHRNDILSDIV